LSEHPLAPTQVWVDDRLAIRDSAIEGRGLFFDRALPAGTTVTRLGGRLVSSAELEVLIHLADTDPDAPYVDTITVYSGAHLVLPPGTPIHFANHSCDPTLWLAGPFEIVTRRDASAGEATLDYGTISGAEGFQMECHCRAGNCRGTVTSADWQRFELQERYRGHWTPALRSESTD
jgi:hypothetical protein